MGDRTSFLARVRSAVGDAELPDRPDGVPVVEAPDLPEADLLSLFCHRLESVDGEAHVISSGDVPQLVGGILRRSGATTLMAWTDPHLPLPGLSAELATAGVTIVDHETPFDDHAGHNLTYTELDAGLTGAVAGLAESGSIVLDSGPGRPRMASLVPLLHMALMPRSALYRSLTHLAVDRPDLLEGSTNTVVITGPSRTADIEQTLNLGVHGPRHLHVVVIEDL